MSEPQTQTRIDETDAKAGSTTGHVRWVLAISVSLAIVALTLIWVTGALSQNDVESQGTASARDAAVAEQQGDASQSSIDGMADPAEQ
ncbi:hypothetical protein [Erythrobacter donghaensis]|uniref:hypothetical protein n=1 Tax=Erythrobacter donghaensis TaxID=267135 RepID=UPI001B80BDE9|nr:hypothetical protein [Erythrobacter donghaensis]